MIATIPPRGHFADASISLDADGVYMLSVGTAEFGNGTTTVHTQLAATELNTVADRVVIRQSDTDAPVTTPARSARPAPWSPGGRCWPRAGSARHVSRRGARGYPDRCS